MATAKGSAGELRTQVYMARDQRYMTNEEFNATLSLAETCSKQLARFIQYLESQPNTRRIRDEGESYDVE